MVAAHAAKSISAARNGEFGASQHEVTVTMTARWPDRGLRNLQGVEVPELEPIPANYVVGRSRRQQLVVSNYALTHKQVSPRLI